MLVKNSEFLRNEILCSLRREYIDVINNAHLHIQDTQINVHLNAMNCIVEQWLIEGKYEFKTLASMVKTQPILPSIGMATISFTDDLHDESSLLGISSTPSESELLNLTNENYVYNLKEPGFIPKDRLVSFVGDNVAIIYRIDPAYDGGLSIRTNIIPVDPNVYIPEELLILEPIINDIEKMWIEYTHYKTIYNYFSTLFTELPSLNQMYKACPTILNYISNETSLKLFATIKDRDDEKLKKLQPTGEISVALGRNKLRGKR